jgi:hypothetical protein
MYRSVARIPFNQLFFERITKKDRDNGAVRWDAAEN